MSTRPLQAVSGLTGPHLTELLARALDGSGPALLPIAEHTPQPLVRALIDTLRPSSLRTPDGVTPLPHAEGVADDTALVIATSGSTGTPKGAELAAAALLASSRASTARIGAAAGQTWWCVLPTAHISGLQVILRALATGGDVVFDPFDTPPGGYPHVSLVPTQLRRLLAAGADLSAYASILLGGAPADDALLEQARGAGGRVVTTYGMSETCGGCVYDGRPLDGVTADTDPEGRILLSGPVLFSGYRLRPDLTRHHLVADGDGRTWFRTGDLGGFGTDGRLRIRGRLDDVINTGGHKVVPGEVASVLAALDSVAEAVVVGRADPEWGTRVTAVVVPADPADPPTLDRIRAHVRAHLPAHAAPRELDLRAALPLLDSGKPDLAALRRPPDLP
ncbi:O-succinylbenzoic acid--CoA ligase [Murinocardiopsis flavida]|uniref:O-succinylbenzoic acid--CoA ligase n=1 Tax=Murinocardiopsis flavida TaxID=645275 RepID=A0A2P8DSD2_9ACTN|nr:AMP-binding protein [Murinocardiopsis flavida]PSL00120.1 O-succinylbenzoic acid--CoA ligase [Murinocardiopsis flavida]